MSIIEGIRRYLEECPLLDGEKINVNYLGAKPVSYTVDNLPAEPVLKRYCDGGELRQFCFAFASREGYDASARENMQVSVFFEEFIGWLEEQNRMKNFPQLPACNKPLGFEVIKSGFLYDSADSSARFQAEIRLIYRV